MADLQTVLSRYLFKIAYVLSEEFSGKERRNQSGKRLKALTHFFLVCLLKNDK